ncbi:hypothetical protein ACWEVP_47265 [Amycolatopsis sp. NPDC003865]
MVNTPAHVPGRSDDALIREIRQRKDFQAPRKPLAPAIGLDGRITIRPLEALHRLAVATRPRYQDDVLGQYQWWGLLRYLGFFENFYSRSRVPDLLVSDAGQRIVGNQRRVTSEEMGIAFGTALAARWFDATKGVSLRSVVDIDVALDARFVFKSDVEVKHVGTRRPDYLLLGTDPRNGNEFVSRVLECKGTKNARTAVAQLARGVGQLDGVEVGGRVPDGLATAVVTGDRGVSYLAVDPSEDDEPFYRVTQETIDRARTFRLESDRVEDTAAEIIGAAVRASWAVLADFGGNTDAIQNWAPEVMRNRIQRRPRQRVTFETELGPAHGTSFAFDFGQERLTVKYGIDAAVDQQLSGESAQAVMDAQQTFAGRLRATENRDRPQEPRTAYSATPDGSILLLTTDD